ncbi:MAG: large conductance mechanosensitive channel protein MscL [Thermonemataceae bacterium]|nr:large conductance mechanosensitive channel protein MscL [Thermonemataceae bacterium]
MFKEFKEFALKGSLIDLAVGFVMGAAFTKLTTTFINGMIMPLVGMVQGKDLKDWKIVLKDAVMENGKEKTAEVAIKYGDFITTAIEFFIIAFVMFLVVKVINKLKKQKEAEKPVPSTQEVLLTEIRDLLKK